MALEAGAAGELGVRPITDAEFDDISRFVYRYCGINLTPAKKTMVSGRLMKRLRQLGLSRFGDYFAMATSPGAGQHELTTMINLLTTNKTDFFRQPDQFQLLTHTLLPRLTALARLRSRRHIAVWSAGCSSGEEPYTIAFVLQEFVRQHPGWGYSILATDISTRRLEEAVRAVYTEEVVEPVPLELKRRYLLRGVGEHTGTFRVAPEIRKQITFRALNLMTSDLSSVGSIDLLFCRNVTIYFDRPTQRALVARFDGQLASGGYYFVGHSESLHGIFEGLTLVAPTVYIKDESAH
ncbi:MAG: protein-glutamate O-methyltransferase CheR [Thermodesulfobacteriota bacterium]